jgi:hypothetical protein
MTDAPFPPLAAMPPNPRRAYDKDGREIPPATMANIREQGINTLWATCQRIGCGHEAKIDASRFPDDMPVPDVGLRLRCSKCGGRNVYTMADWSASDWHKRYGAGP